VVYAAKAPHSAAKTPYHPDAERSTVGRVAPLFDLISSSPWRLSLNTGSAHEPPRFVTGDSFLEGLLAGELGGQEKYDPDIVALVRKHLAGDSIRSRAGQDLADDLAALARSRASEAVPK